MICVEHVLSLSRSPSKHKEGGNGMLRLRNVDRVMVTSCQKCCTGGQSQSAWK